MQPPAIQRRRYFWHQTKVEIVGRRDINNKIKGSAFTLAG